MKRNFQECFKNPFNFLADLHLFFPTVSSSAATTSRLKRFSAKKCKYQVSTEGDFPCNFYIFQNKMIEIYFDAISIFHSLSTFKWHTLHMTKTVRASERHTISILGRGYCVTVIKSSEDTCYRFQ